MIKYFIFSFLLISQLNSIAHPFRRKADTDTATVRRINEFINGEMNSKKFRQYAGFYTKDSVKLENYFIDHRKKTFTIIVSDKLAYAPIRPWLADSLQNAVSRYFNGPEKSYQLVLKTGIYNIDELVPNYYRPHHHDWDKQRMNNNYKRKSLPLVSNLSKPYQANQQSLYNINIALWSSHGWYYEPKLHRWEWQRARLFGTVEDLYTMSYTHIFLIPMLENAGATVFLPKERHWQKHEIIIDNNSADSSSNIIFKYKPNRETTGFAPIPVIYANENPFESGTAAIFEKPAANTQLAQWVPNIPESGEYPVYISYATLNNAEEKAIYAVNHSGGTTQFQINQSMSGSTWVYLGTFEFAKGKNPDKGSVVLSSPNKSRNKNISADATRFGTGMGNISRNGLTSRRSRFFEASRYFLQNAGFPDSLVWNTSPKRDNDYVDDYQSRGEWVTYLNQQNPKVIPPGFKQCMNIPVDLSFALHTDAGIAGKDSVIGSLSIISTRNDRDEFPSKISKMASRDLADIVQSQLVYDIQRKYDTNWIRRSIWDKQYSEAVRPNTPTMLLELLSHQNLLDAHFGDEPMFRFDVSRAIYKGIMRFLSVLYDIDYIIQPLPVSHFKTEFDADSNFVLSWQAVNDELEPTAIPEKYIVYQNINHRGFDNGTLVNTNSFVVKNPQADSIYSFKISAWNHGGESFPSEELSICRVSGSKGTIAIINAFDRVGGASWCNDSIYGGKLSHLDMGVPYQWDFHATGAQFNFIKSSPWKDDDEPGFGASHSDLETTVIPGNTFNFSYIHGQSFLNAGYSFVSMSDEAFENSSLSPEGYIAIDLLAGEEKTTYMPKNDSMRHFQIFTTELIQSLSGYLNSGGNLLVSGAYIATDANMNNQDTIIGNLLKYKHRSNMASRTGMFYFMDTAFSNPNREFEFNTRIHPSIYTVEAADALVPWPNSGASTFVRYSENNMSAGIAYRGKYNVIALGFPMETIISLDERNKLFKNILQYLVNKNR